jgi:hypothetical protein
MAQVRTQTCGTCGNKRVMCAECGEQCDPSEGNLLRVLMFFFYVILLSCALGARCDLERIGVALEAQGQQQPCQCESTEAEEGTD